MRAREGLHECVSGDEVRARVNAKKITMHFEIMPRGLKKGD